MSGAVCALDVRSASKSYGGATVALEDVSIELQAGEAHAPLGENGAGAIVASLTLAERQRLKITRAFARDPKALILDEPTAALAETDWLFGLVRQATR